MSVETELEQKVWSLIDEMASKDKLVIGQLFDLLMWGHYVQEALSQFGMGYSGTVFRQRPAASLMTIKVLESGVPLVAFVTSHTAIGCIEQMFDLLWAGRLKWQKDLYPWI